MNSVSGSDELFDLYQASRGDVDGIDGDTLLAYVEGTLTAEQHAAVTAQLEAAPAAQAVVGLLRDLKPESKALAEAAAERRGARHSVARRDQRRIAAAPARRVARWSGAIAACAMVAVALFSLHGLRTPSGTVESTAGDRIFSMRDDRIFDWTSTAARTPQAGDADRVFTSGFAGKGS